MHKERESLVEYHKNNTSNTAISLSTSDTIASMVVPVLLLFIVFVISVPKFDITAVIIYGAFPLFAMIAFRVPFGLVCKRLLVLSPFVIIMAAANPILDRQVFVTIGGFALSQGVVSGVVIIVKSFVVIGSIIIFSHCIQFTSFCKVLRAMKTPEIFVTQLLLLYRYSFLLFDEAMAMQRARSMRSFGKSGRGMVTTAKLIGSLLLRTISHGDHIYRAMVARGFNGGIGSTTTSFKFIDIIVVIALFILFLLIRIIF